MFKNKTFKYSLLIKLLFSLALYPCALANQSIPLKSGERAPVDGVLMDAEAANQVKTGLLERDLYKELSDSQTHSIDLLKQNMIYSEDKVNKLLDQNDKLSEQLKNSQSFTNLERIGLVLLGIVITVGAGVALKSVAK